MGQVSPNGGWDKRGVLESPSNCKILHCKIHFFCIAKSFFCNAKLFFCSAKSNILQCKIQVLAWLKLFRKSQNPSKNNAPPRQKQRGDPWGPKGPQPSLFGGVGRCYSLILDGGGMLFFDFGWIFGLFLIFGGWPQFSFFF